MKLVSFGSPGSERPGFLEDGRIYPIDPLAMGVCGRAIDVNEIIARWNEVFPALKARMDAVEAIPLESVRLGPPNPAPRSIVAIGFNYRQHAARAVDKLPRPDVPIAFLKAVTSLAGPRDPIVKPPETSCLDYEIELAVVIGRECYRVAPQDAAAHIFGYVAANDLTARDIFMGEADINPFFMQVTRGKGAPTFCPLGPWIATKDEVPSVPDLNLMLSVNGELRQHDQCASMVVSVEKLIASVSSSIRLLTGDLLLTGTPAGCAFEMPAPSYLTPGDILSASIDCLGEMRNEVIEPSEI